MRLKRRQTKLDRASDARSTFVNSRVIDLTETLALVILDVPFDQWPDRSLDIYDRVGAVLLHPEVRGTKGQAFHDAMAEFVGFDRKVPDRHSHQVRIDEGNE